MPQGPRLLALQDLDLALMRGRKELDEMPEKTSILVTRKRVKELDALHARAQAAVDDISREVSRDDDDAATVGAKMRSEQARLMSGQVTNPKEVHAITRELDSLRRRKEKLEMDGLSALERRETAEGQAGKIKAAIDKTRAEETRLIDEFKRKGGLLQARIAQLERERKSVAQSVEPGIIARYEDIRTAKGGIGAARLQDGRCSACRVELPGEKLASLKAGPEIGTCPNCRRLLVVTPSEEEGA